MNFERTLYWVIWIGATLYSLYAFCRKCQQDQSLIDNQNLFRPGTLFPTLYDSSDFEWQSIKTLYKDHAYIVTFHFIISNIFLMYNRPELKLSLWMVATLFAIYSVLGLNALLLIIANVIMLNLVIIQRKKLLCYVVCLTNLAAAQITGIASRIFYTGMPEDEFAHKKYLLIACLVFLNARGLSAGIDSFSITTITPMTKSKRSQPIKEAHVKKAITISAYLLYLPGFFTGPIHLYEDFEKTARLSERPGKHFVKERFILVTKAVSRVIVNVLLYEFMLHLLYSSAVTHQPALIGDYDLWQLSGFVFSLAILFFMKYRTVYSFFTMVATLDGHPSIAPPLPQCIFTMHLGSQLWRNFDVGIYRWLFKYIYKPMLGSNYVQGRIFATSGCFLSVLLWHLPIKQTVIIWLVLNHFSINCEIFADVIARGRRWRKFENTIGRDMLLRMYSLLSTPYFLLTFISNAFFISNEATGFRIVDRLGDKSLVSPVLILFLYFGANFSLDYNASKNPKPGKRISPAKRTSPGKRVTPPKRASPPKRVSPPKRLSRQ